MTLDAVWRPLYAHSVIRSDRDSATCQFTEKGKSSFSGLDIRKAQMRLQMLDAVSDLAQIPPLASIGLHKLKGNRRDEWAMTINGPWRICFRFAGGDAHDVEIADYH